MTTQTKQFSSHYTVAGTAVKEICLRMAKNLLTLPDGSWPETLQAERQLADELPSGVGLPQVLEFAARHTRHVHSSRMEWLRQLGRRYSATDASRVYPALAV